MTTISKIYAALKQVVDPTLNKDIVALGYVQNIEIDENDVSFEIILPDAKHPNAKEFKQKAQEALEQIIDIGKIKIALKVPLKDRDPLENVSNLIAISSCKGGVGKSTLAIHTALELSRRGLKVGLLDCDIYGPSLPTLLNLKINELYSNEAKQLIPIEHNGLKVMSFGFLLGDKPAIMRGPIVTRYIQQILLNTDWGKLDYLIIDMPPGTGDIHLTITQAIRLTGAVIVTTPHTLSLIDVARGILMFEKVNVPILGILENMAYFQTDESQTKHYLFGDSSVDSLSKRFGVAVLAQIPILKSLGQLTNDVVPNSYIQDGVDRLLDSLREVKERSTNLPKIDFDDTTIRLNWSNGNLWEVSNFDLRLNSQDALSVDEITGKKILTKEDIRPDIAAKEITPLGNYAIGITWNDGHSAGIYPYALVEELAKKN